MDIPIVYEDDWLLIVNKPAGLLTIPTPRNESYTLTTILNAESKKNNLAYRLHPCHRLDRETSGLIIYAKGKSVQQKMMEFFRQRKIKKRYIAFVQGHPARAAGEISDPIAGESAVSRYKVVEKRKDFAIVEVEPLTGRTNQIRIHLKEIGHPVVGEKKFVFRRDFKLKANRLCLYAKSLEFLHPVTDKLVSVQAELPLGMRNFLKKHS